MKSYLYVLSICILVSAGLGFPTQQLKSAFPSIPAEANSISSSSFVQNLEALLQDDQNGALLLERPERDAVSDRNGENEDESGDDYEGGEDDTVVIEAASCEELLQSCKESSNIVSCSTYDENCQQDDLNAGPDEDVWICALLGNDC